jgi:hypothetical protein
VRRALAEGRDAETEPAAIDVQYRLWLKTAKALNAWIAIQEGRGYMVDNLTTFRECEQAVQKYVDELDRMKALAKQVPPPEDLALIAVDPAVWLSEATQG